MPTKTLMSREEYLTNGFEGPEPDYVDGELVDRPMPNLFHSRIQIRLSDAFKASEDRRELFRSSEIRLLVAPDRFRIADFALFSSRPTEAVPELTPIAIVEIVSPDERYEDLLSKLADYEEAGVEYIFVADPPLERLWRYNHGDLLALTALELASPEVKIPLSSIFVS